MKLIWIELSSAWWRWQMPITTHFDTAVRTSRAFWKISRRRLFTLGRKKTSKFWEWKWKDEIWIHLWCYFHFCYRVLFNLVDFEFYKKFAKIHLFEILTIYDVFSDHFHSDFNIFDPALLDSIFYWLEWERDWSRSAPFGWLTVMKAGRRSAVPDKDILMLPK